MGLVHVVFWEEVGIEEPALKPTSGAQSNGFRMCGTMARSMAVGGYTADVRSIQESEYQVLNSGFLVLGFSSFRF
jgi:hypothetical protein